MSDTSFGFLLFGSVGAIGAALALGTLAALWRYHRTGAFPGHDTAEVVPRGKLVRMWIRVVLGVPRGRLRGLRGGCLRRPLRQAPFGYGSNRNVPVRNVPFVRRVREAAVERRIFTEEHDQFRQMVRGLPAGRGRAVPRPVGARRHRPARAVEEGRRAGSALHRRARPSTAAAGSPTSVTTSSSPRSCATSAPRGVGFPLAQRRRRALLPQVRHRGAEAALPAGDVLRRDHHRDRDDRARHRVGPRGGQDHRDRAGRRQLPAQRRQDLHHQRHHRRPRDRGRQDRPDRHARRHLAAARRAWDGGLRAWPQAREDRHGRAGHRRAVLQRRSGPGGERPR